MKALRNWLFLRRHFRACRKLQRIVEANRRSFELQDHVKRRNAMLKHTRRLAG
jgi:hypothetical protein